MTDDLRAGREARGKVLNDGREHWLDIHIVTLHNRQGRVTHFAAIQRLVAWRPAHGPSRLVSVARQACYVFVSGGCRFG